MKDQRKQENAIVSTSLVWTNEIVPNWSTMWVEMIDYFVLMMQRYKISIGLCCSIKSLRILRIWVMWRALI